MSNFSGKTTAVYEESEFSTDFINKEAFEREIVPAYGDGSAERQLPADVGVALSWIPPATGRLRDFSTLGPDIPILNRDNCVGCMECVTECPDTAIIAKVIPESEYKKIEAEKGADSFEVQQFVKTKKFYEVPAKKGKEPGMYYLITDPSKCKGCGECVVACGKHDALSMVPKNDAMLEEYQDATDLFRSLPDTPDDYIQEKVLSDIMLKDASQLYVGGAASCMGCGEATAIRMMLAATGFVYGADGVGIVASTGCNTVYGATYPYNPYTIPWTNSLFENSPAVAMGVRGQWDAQGFSDRKLWVLGGDGAMLDIGFQSLSRMLMSGLDIKVLVLDTQVYSNTGGQSSTATFMSQDSKMAAFGKVIRGKSERRKEITSIAMMHPDVFVAQTTCAHINHFYRAVMDANTYSGPALINVYSPCQPEHGIADDASSRQARLAVDTRAFPLLSYDPRRGETYKERLNLVGNPSMKEDWHKTREGERVDFVSFARTEGRFAKQFDKEGKSSAALDKAQGDRLKNWRMLQELAGIERKV